MRTNFLGAILLAIGMLASPASAKVDVDLHVNLAPPPVIVETPPPPRAGFAWAPGYWEWRHGRHVWRKGHWIKARPGYLWEPPHWVERNGRWHFVPGHWVPV
jgi:hypothetical protein